MFEPCNGEVLVGRISGYDDKGLQVSLDFFSDMHPRTFDAIWHSEACRISSGTLLLRPIAVDFFKNRQRESRSDS